MDYLQQIANSLAEYIGMDAAEVAGMLETPPNPEMGDYAMPCFKLARTMRKAPPMIAADLAENCKIPAFIDRTEVAGGYLNFFIKKTAFAETTLKSVLEAGERYGASDEGNGKTVVLDYSSINIAKPFHIGHLSTTAIGNSLYRIYEFLGYKCVGVNHLGDWGTQFGKLISAYKRWGNDDEIEKSSIHAMLALYVKFHEEAEKHPELNDEGRAWFKKIEEGDEEAMSIFNRFKEMTLKEVGRVYDMLGIHFDSYAGESFYNDKMQPVIDELFEKKLLEESDGAYVVRMDEENLPPAIILKSDGTTIYATRDLAAAFYRKKTYDFHKCLYVVAYQQNLHFKQIFKVIEKMGYEWYKDMEHVNFGMVSLTDGTLSTRKGKVVFLEDVLKASIEKCANLIEEKSPNLPDKEQVAKDIGVGAVVFSVLSNNRIKDIVFDFDRVLNFDGETGPYVQYTNARARSLIRKAEGKYDGVVRDYTALDNEDAFAVLRILESFPENIRKAMQKNEPSIITRQVIQLAQAFNRFYYDHRVFDENEGQTAARLDLAAATAAVLKTGLGLLGINAPERM